MSNHDSLHQYPSVTKPWLRYYLKDFTRKGVPQCTVYEQMYSRNARISDAVALVYGDKEITFGSLFREIESTAAAFSSLGVRSGDTVTICSFTIPEVVYSFYALNMLGVVCNFIDPRTNDERILHYIKECDSRVALVWEESISRFLSFQRKGALDKIILLSPSDSASRQDFCGSKQNNSDSSFLRWNTFRKGAIGATPIPYPYQKDYPAAILYTGGTTGIPKGVVLSNDALNTITVEYDECGIEYAVGQRFLNIMPPFVASGLVCGINMILGLGLASLMFIQIVFFVPFLWIMLWRNMMALSWRNFWASIIGLIAPYWFVGAYCVISHQTDLFIGHFLSVAKFQPLFVYEHIDEHLIVTLVFILLLGVTGSIHFLRNSFFDKIRTRLIYYVFMTMLFLSVIFIVLQPMHAQVLLRIMTISSSILIAHFIALTRTRFTNIAVILFMILALIITVYNLWIPSLLF